MKNNVTIKNEIFTLKERHTLENFSTKLDENRCDSGHVVTPNGIVLAYAQGSDLHRHLTRLQFHHNGQEHVRVFYGKRYGHGKIVDKAKEFTLDVVNMESTNG